MNAALKMRLEEVTLLPAITEAQRRGELSDVEPQAHSATAATLLVRILLLGLLVAAGFGARADWEMVELPAWWPWPLAASAPCAQARPLVQHFDGSQPLKQGDLIVVETPHLPRVRQVVAGPGEVVVLRHGETVDGFFMTGARSFMVGSEVDGIVRADRIRGLIASNSRPPL